MGSAFLCALKWLVSAVNASVPTVIGVLVGGFLVKRYWVRKSNESLILEYLARELDIAVKETLEYWSLDCSGAHEENRKEARKLEQRIKASLKNLAFALDDYATRYCPKVTFSKNAQELVDACTNGTFEEAKRKDDRRRFLLVINAAHRVRWQLFDRRI